MKLLKKQYQVVKMAFKVAIYKVITMISTPVTIQNQLGLHARASAKLVKEASKYASSINLDSVNGKTVNAKSIMGVMMLGAKIGDQLTLSIDGEDEHDALYAITELFDDKFGEYDEDPE